VLYRRRADTTYELLIYSVDAAACRDGRLAIFPVTRRLDRLSVMALPSSKTAARRLLASDLETVLIECWCPPFSIAAGRAADRTHRTRHGTRHVRLPLTTTKLEAA